MGKLLHIPHALGLDAACVGVLWSFLVGRAFGVGYSWPTAMALGLAVFSIYCIDRVWDPGRVGKRVTFRHRIAFKHRGVFLLAGSVAGLLAVAVAVGFLPVRMLAPGIVVGVGAGAYFVFRILCPQAEASPLRALAIGAVFSGGVMLPAFSGDVSGISFLLVFLCATTLFAANAWECIAAERGPGWAGRRNWFWIPAWIFAGLTIPWTVAPLISLGALSFLARAGRGLPADSYAALADAALLLPGALLLIPS